MCKVVDLGVDLALWLKSINFFATTMGCLYSVSISKLIYSSLTTLTQLRASATSLDQICNITAVK